jgi:hypothetical protein
MKSGKLPHHVAGYGSMHWPHLRLLLGNRMKKDSPCQNHRRIFSDLLFFLSSTVRLSKWWNRTWLCDWDIYPIISKLLEWQTRCSYKTHISVSKPINYYYHNHTGFENYIKTVNNSKYQFLWSWQFGLRCSAYWKRLTTCITEIHLSACMIHYGTKQRS